jgi:uncharacterized protein (DUF362 family)
MSAGLSLIDTSTAMTGNGPTNSSPVVKELIIGATNLFNTDMAGSELMSSGLNALLSIRFAHECAIPPATWRDIEIQGLVIEQNKRLFFEPDIRKWTDVRKFWGAKES